MNKYQRNKKTIEKIQNQYIILWEKNKIDKPWQY